MEKIKIIDLLNMIAEMEKVPDKVKFDDVIYKYDKIRRDYYDKINDKYLINMLIKRYKMYYALNKIAEIIEEDNNKIEYLEEKDFDDDIDTDEKCEILREWYQDLKNKQDEIIDKLNNMEENYGRK